MPNVLVWGKTRDLIAGDLPPGLPIAEVSSLEEARRQGDSRGTLLLTDPATIEAHEQVIQKWLRGGGSTGTLLVVVAEATAGDELLRRFPFVDELLVKPVTAGRLRLRLDRAMDALHSRRVVRQLEEALERRGEEIKELNKIGVALSAERDINKLLDLILAKSREITAADAGSLYLVERGKDRNAQSEDVLRFKLTQNDSVLAPFEESTMPLAETSMAGYAALKGKSVNVSDAYDLPRGSPFQISRSFDEQSGYRTKSMLVVPMRDHKDEVIGVVQLINKKRDPGAVLRPPAVVDEEVIPFTAVDEELVTSLASQAAVAFENTRLLADIRNLFDSFVRASVTAIEKRDPTTKDHSARVAILTVGLAERTDAVSVGPYKDVRFSKDQLEEIRYASLLHDFGKVSVKEKYLIKGKKLYFGEMLLVRQRFAYIRRTLEAEYLRKKVDKLQGGLATPDLLAEMEAAYKGGQAEIDEIEDMVKKANEPSILEEDTFRALMDLPARTFSDIQGNPQPFLTLNEVQALSIRRGSLSDEERRAIESHVQHTYEFLKEIPWTGEFARVPDIAHAHHEKMDGKGYPQKLKGLEIPLQSRMMTIADIYDALVAWDRPYKKAAPVELALDILRDEAKQGKLDGDLLRLFIDAKIYERTPRQGTLAEIAR